MLDPYDLRERITIQQFVVSGTDENTNKATGDWETLATVWAKVLEVSTSEEDNEDVMTALGSYTLTIRLLTTVTEQMQVIYRDQTLNIGSIGHDRVNQSTTIQAAVIK